MRTEPPAFGLGHGTAKRVFPQEARLLERALVCCERSCRVALPEALGQLAGDSHHEPQPILEIVDLGFPQKPRPIEIGISTQDPRQRLDDARVDVMGSKDS
ncbi:MAG TPA: hypothetical protein VNI78_07845 [Vicinamibacterales bacterium]|nr:hypothetical protein [Vicinamibacterales bacterium]